jgi:hypothetical protein
MFAFAASLIWPNWPAFLTMQVANFAPAFHATEGRIWCPSLTNLPRLAEDQNQTGRAAIQHITHFPQKNYALVADSSIWLLALYLPFSVLIFCGQFCSLVKKFTNTFFTWSQLSDWEYYKNMITRFFFFSLVGKSHPLRLIQTLGIILIEMGTSIYLLWADNSQAPHPFNLVPKKRCCLLPWTIQN